jgi:hypothetical protein
MKKYWFHMLLSFVLVFATIGCGSVRPRAADAAWQSPQTGTNLRKAPSRETRERSRTERRVATPKRERPSSTREKKQRPVVKDEDFTTRGGFR